MNRDVFYIQTAKVELLNLKKAKFSNPFLWQNKYYVHFILCFLINPPILKPRAGLRSNHNSKVKNILKYNSKDWLPKMYIKVQTYC